VKELGGRCKRRWPRDVGRFIISPLVCVCRARTIVAMGVSISRSWKSDLADTNYLGTDPLKLGCLTTRLWGLVS
jgi:hypothetical protein